MTAGPAPTSGRMPDTAVVAVVDRLATSPAHKHLVFALVDSLTWVTDADASTVHAVTHAQFLPHALRRPAVYDAAVQVLYLPAGTAELVSRLAQAIAASALTDETLTHCPDGYPGHCWDCTFTSPTRPFAAAYGAAVASALDLHAVHVPEVFTREPHTGLLYDEPDLAVRDTAVVLLTDGGYTLESALRVARLLQ